VTGHPRITRLKDRLVHLFFTLGVWAKGIDGVLEIIGGVLLFFFGPAQIKSLVRSLTQHELSEDPHDLIANYLLNSVRQLTTGAELFAAVYLLWHGAVKVGLVTALLLRERWAYPVAIIAFALFLAYQLYRWSHTHSVELLVLSVLDIFVIVITWLEYRRLTAAHYFS
jgi:uncharacterized membrane protein